MFPKGENQMSVKINFNELPTSTINLDAGIYLVNINDIVVTKTKNGLDAFVVEFQIVNDTVKLNDYIFINNSDGTPHNFGRKKLRTFIEATGVEIVDITPSILKQLLTGKQIKAEIQINDRGYPEVVYDRFYSRDSEYDVKNNEEAKEEIVEGVVSPEIVEAVSPADFEDDDI